MIPQISEEEIWSFLKAIEDGSVTLVREGYVGSNVVYQASNGWRIVIFDDCGEWDYIDRIETDDGRSIDYTTMADHMPRVDRYYPPDDVVRDRYHWL